MTTERTKKLKKKQAKEAQDKFHANLPEDERNPNQLEDFEALLLKAVTTIEGKGKPKVKRSRRDKSVKVEMGLIPKRKK